MYFYPTGAKMPRNLELFRLRPLSRPNRSDRDRHSLRRNLRPNFCLQAVHFVSLWWDRERDLSWQNLMLVEPSAFMEAVAYHALGKQKKDDCQEDYKQEPSNSEPG
jgi:hypothetical protein